MKSCTKLNTSEILGIFRTANLCTYELLNYLWIYCLTLGISCRDL